MKLKLIIFSIFFCFLPLGIKAQSIPLDNAWILDPGIEDKIPNIQPSSVQFKFPVSPLPDPQCQLNPEMTEFRFIDDKKRFVSSPGDIIIFENSLIEHRAPVISSDKRWFARFAFVRKLDEDSSINNSF